MTNTKRSEAMKAAWATRKAAKAGAMTVEQFMANPRCLCSCGAELPQSKRPEKQTLYAPGHDARVKGQLLKVVRGEAAASSINPAVRTMKAFVKFLSTRPELADALR